MADRHGTPRTARRLILACVVAAGAMIFASLASAHIERPAYWPNPTADRALSPPVGGAVPRARSLGSALTGGRKSHTRVVCQPGSLARALRSIKAARSTGFRVRPSQPRRKISAAHARGLARVNRALARHCHYREIQPAITASHNHDRVVVMPGVYAEPTSRQKPTFDAKCKKYLTDTDFGGGGHIGLSYRYQFNCPNDQNLIIVLGRALGPGTAPAPQIDRHGIPKSDLGRCIRCGLQLEGSGPKADDVVIDSGNVKAGNGGPSGAGSKKDVAVRADRADGFVLRDVTVRHAKEHDAYMMETDGYLLDHVKLLYAGEYGQLTFASDHGLTQNCEGKGNGDSAVYPGGAPDSGDDPAPGAHDQRDHAFYPKHRLNQEIRYCDLHHNNLAYSGTMGNATHVDHNEIYDNTAGIATDSYFAGGHPGFPQDSAVYELNNIHSNNFNDYAPGSDVTSRVGVPLGTGILIAGGNGDTVRGNRIWDNWRRGTMLIAVPDAISCPPSAPGTPQTCTADNVTTTSFGNNYYKNTVGTAPNGAKKLNGVDFWWDQFPSTTGNCWHDNSGPGHSNSSWTSDPPRAPIAGTSTPGFLPEACGAPGSAGTGNPAKESMLAVCAEVATGDKTCEWYVQPKRPQGTSSAAQRSARLSATRLLNWQRITAPPCVLVGTTQSCSLFASRP